MTITWQLKNGSDRRFKSGHPWVYSNELAESPKGIEPGAPIELKDSRGEFLARGYGNPLSLISFRTLTRDSSVDPFSEEFLFNVIKRAKHFRTKVGLGQSSHRLLFGEADGIPGLVVDRYLLTSGEQVFVIQAHTAGADHLLPYVISAIERVTHGSLPSWEQTGIVIRNDIRVRCLEGLKEEEPRVLRELKGVALTDTSIRVKGALGNLLDFSVDLLNGQKTGFFLDQSANIQLAALKLSPLFKPGTSIKLLDLCSYVGHWSSQLAHVFKRHEINTNVTLLDASKPALQFAKKNVEAQGATCQPLKGNIFEDLASLPANEFDIIIADPPALIKGRKDLAKGQHAYLQLNTQVFRMIKHGGGVVSCSCSALLPEDSWMNILSKAASRNHTEVKWIARGGPAPDHPMKLEFPEGHYLKALIGVVE